MNEMKLFENEQFGGIRVLERDGERILSKSLNITCEGLVFFLNAFLAEAKR